MIASSVILYSKESSRIRRRRSVQPVEKKKRRKQDPEERLHIFFLWRQSLKISKQSRNTQKCEGKKWEEGWKLMILDAKQAVGSIVPAV